MPVMVGGVVGAGLAFRVDLDRGDDREGVGVVEGVFDSSGRFSAPVVSGCPWSILVLAWYGSGMASSSLFTLGDTRKGLSYCYPSLGGFGA